MGWSAAQTILDKKSFSDVPLDRGVKDRLTGDSKRTAGVDVRVCYYLSLCVGPVMCWLSVQCVPLILPSVSCDPKWDKGFRKWIEERKSPPLLKKIRFVLLYIHLAVSKKNSLHTTPNKKEE